MSFLNLALTKDFISVLSDGQITENEQAIRTYFKKFYVSPNGFLVGVTGFHKITEEILVQFHYQPHLTPLEAQGFLLSALLRYKDKRSTLTKKVAYNAVIAFFDNGQPQARTYHIEDGMLSTKDYTGSSLISFPPDDIDFDPNKLISTHLKNGQSLLPTIQLLQRNVLYRIAENSKTVNKTVFQEVIKKETSS
ncbi:hypothetical protein NF715_05980 [Lactococcus formosensis]|uniref:Uncharacterized protein n=1 Tax=Lactococcus formosensis TaxID=1281486 RepID=A0A9X4NX75_9LACT|nr:hypothetical protein [Lactococcus formosensis]MDG6111054.1 hypothetical protein [Lactococcus formosensis]MDG6117338.1 hypothetical protein [Lactococcus formosensis]MDG6132795.1 hypothetical protein [Lactococcus formosensis]MDG6134790.1 hypothetical protein [Lactococcus formosensis]MDG6137802.1 hypothetical protein [Lactococcus formosensis]